MSTSYRPFTPFGREVMAIVQAGEIQPEGKSEAFIRERLAKLLYEAETPIAAVMRQARNDLATKLDPLGDDAHGDY